jgi:cyclophilin family peptidyl-prolyl cis-trans isomerase
MTNSGANTNGSQFFSTYAKQPHLNGHYTVFSKVIHGFEVFGLMEKTPTGPGATLLLRSVSTASPLMPTLSPEPELKLDASEKQAAKGTISTDEPGTYNPGEASSANNSHEVLTFFPVMSLCFVECSEGGESTSDLKEAASASSAYLYDGIEESGN